VIYRGGTAPRVVFVGEAPGAEEDRTGLPFQGRSGKRLDAAIATFGLGPS
jgi:uracil-DNA glycosylase